MMSLGQLLKTRWGTPCQFFSTFFSFIIKIIIILIICPKTLPTKPFVSNFHMFFTIFKNNMREKKRVPCNQKFFSFDQWIRMGFYLLNGFFVGSQKVIFLFFIFQISTPAGMTHFIWAFKVNFISSLACRTWQGHVAQNTSSSMMLYVKIQLTFVFPSS